jgi:hypothetical protein
MIGCVCDLVAVWLELENSMNFGTGTSVLTAAHDPYVHACACTSVRF